MPRLWRLSGPRSRGVNPLNIVQAVECIDSDTGQPVTDPATGEPTRFVLSAFDLTATAVQRFCQRAEVELAGRIANEAVRNAAEASLDTLAAAGGVLDVTRTKAEIDLEAARKAYADANRQLVSLQLLVDTNQIRPDAAKYVAAVRAAKTALVALETLEAAEGGK